MKFGMGLLALVVVSMLALPASAALSLTNGNFEADSPVYDPAPGHNVRPLDSSFSPMGWYQSDLTGLGVADPLEDLVIGPIPEWDVGDDGLFDIDTNGDEILDSYLSGGWTGNAISVWQWWNGPLSKEDGWWYTSLGTYSGELAVTLNGKAYRIPGGDASGHFTVEFWYVPMATAFTAADEVDVADAAGATLLGSELVDMSYLVAGNAGEFFSSTQFFDGSGIANGDKVFLKIGDGPDLPPFFDNHDFPVLDNLTLGTNVPGDVDGDNDVDSFDLDVIQTNFGQSLANLSQGDLYDDDIIDLKDFVIWKNHYPYTPPGAGAGGGSSTVPEPTSLALCMLGAFLALAIRRRS